MHSPGAELMRTFSMTVPLLPSMTIGPDGASEPVDFEGLGVGDFVLDAVGFGAGEALVALGLPVGSFVALGELLAAGTVVGRALAVVLGCELCGAGVSALGVGFGVADGVGESVGVAVASSLATVKCPRRLEVRPFDHFNTTRMVCDPSASVVVSYGSAVPSEAVPERSNGACFSVRSGGCLLRRELSR